MRQKSGPKESSAEKHVQAIKRQTRRKFSAEEKIRIVLEGLRGEYSIAELCRREGIAQGLYCSWSKGFLEAARSDCPATRSNHLSQKTSRRTNSSICKRCQSDLTVLVVTRHFDYLNFVNRARARVPHITMRFIAFECDAHRLTSV
jgi:transposase